VKSERRVSGRDTHRKRLRGVMQEDVPMLQALGYMDADGEETDDED
jgi:hypothetical protein